MHERVALAWDVFQVMKKNDPLPATYNMILFCAGLVEQNRLHDAAVVLRTIIKASELKEAQNFISDSYAQFEQLLSKEDLVDFLKVSSWIVKNCSHMTSQIMFLAMDRMHHKKTRFNRGTLTIIRHLKKFKLNFSIWKNNSKIFCVFFCVILVNSWNCLSLWLDRNRTHAFWPSPEIGWRKRRSSRQQSRQLGKCRRSGSTRNISNPEKWMRRIYWVATISTGRNLVNSLRKNSILLSILAHQKSPPLITLTSV